MNNYLFLVQILSPPLLLHLNKPLLRKQTENEKMSCPSTLRNGMLMPALKGETVKKNSQNREFCSYTFLFYWVFFNILWWNYYATIMPQCMIHNENGNLSSTFYVNFVFCLCLYCGIRTFIIFHAALTCLMQTENTINGASNI